VSQTFTMPSLAEHQLASDDTDTDPVVDHDGRFWTSRTELQHIRDLARERLVSPWATLGAVLAHVCARIGPHVVLPPIVGGVASLNTFWGLVGTSGGGKDAALAVARDLLWLNDNIPTHEVGTGQGIDSMFTTQIKGRPVQTCDAALLTLTEIDSLGGHAAMSGSTVMATLRKVYSGSALGARYADKAKRRPVGQHRYRAALVAGIQPARSGILLNDADGGTPQRWVWLPTNDPRTDEHPEPECRTEAADQRIDWHRYQNLLAYGESEEEDDPVPARPRIEIKVCDLARSTIIDNRKAVLAAPLITEHADLNGHSLLARLKVAALLALFNDGRTEVTDDDWALSAHVMRVSDTTRAACAAALATAAHRSNVVRAKQAIEREEIAVNHAMRRVAAALLRVLQRERGYWVARAKLRGSLAGPDRQYFDAAVERLHAAGQIEEEETGRDAEGHGGRGSRYRLAGSVR